MLFGLFNFAGPKKPPKSLEEREILKKHNMTEIVLKFR